MAKGSKGRKKAFGRHEPARYSQRAAKETLRGREARYAKEYQEQAKRSK